MTSSDYRKLSALLAEIKGGTRNSFASVFKMYEKKVYFLFQQKSLPLLKMGIFLSIYIVIITKWP